MLKINTGHIGRKNATKDLGSFFKSSCRITLNVVRKQEWRKKIKPLLLASMSSLVFQLIDHLAFTRKDCFLKHQFSHVAPLVDESLLKSSFTSPMWKVFPNHVKLEDSNPHMFPLDKQSGQIKQGPYIFSIPLRKFCFTERMWALGQHGSVWILFLTLWPWASLLTLLNLFPHLENEMNNSSFCRAVVSIRDYFTKCQAMCPAHNSFSINGGCYCNSFL